MLLSDLKGFLSVQPRSTGLGRISRRTRFAAPAILFFCCAALGAAISRAQDQQDHSVAEAARQERARKQELQKRAKHVYTEEDLKHPNILTPEDRAQVEAKRNECAQRNNCSPAPRQNSPANLDASSPAPGTSLGEVARQLRKQKELQARKPKQSEPFHLPIGTPALASPVLPERPAVHPPAQPVLRPKTSSPKSPANIFRRDPFSAVPVRPELPGPEVRPNIQEDVRPNVHPNFSKDVRPTLRAYGRTIARAQPKISSRPAPPSIAVQPTQPPVPSKPAQPVAPVVTVRPVQPQIVPNSSAIAAQKAVSVQSGDSLWKLAQQNLGSGNRWPEFLAANPRIIDPNQIRVGAQLILPSAVAASPSARRSVPSNAGATMKVRKGDTLWSLAKSNLGRSSAWPCLAAANPAIANPDHIFVGQQLVVPAACHSTTAQSPSHASP